MTKQQKLVVGLGNPGRQYSRTRHNIGFAVVEFFAKTITKSPFTPVPDWQSLVTRKDLVIIAKPQAYMNSSGWAVQQIANHYQIETRSVLVVYDDIDLQFGHIRRRLGGGSAGHRGVESIIAVLGPGFQRLRVGIAPPGKPKADTTKFVLRDFTQKERSQLAIIKTEASKLIDEFVIGQNEPTTRKPLGK